MEKSRFGIPIVLIKLVDKFKNNQDRLKVHGLFRKSGFKSELMKIEDELNKNNFDILKDIDDPILIAGTIYNNNKY